VAPARTALTLLVTMAVIAGVAQAQPGASQGVAIAIPSYIGIRIVGVGSGARAVVFDFETRPVLHLSALLGGGEPLAPTDVNRFDDVHLNITANGRWNAWVYATTLTTPAGPDAHDLTPANIRVIAEAVSNLQPDAVVGPGGSSFFAGSWALSTNPERIARGIDRTSGWRSLGFSGHDYLLDVDGGETPGDLHDRGHVRHRAALSVCCPP
jgi:hypothetical protein